MERMCRDVAVFGVLVLVAAGCDGGLSGVLQDAASGRDFPKLVSAKGLSRHYVEVSFAEAVGAEALDAAMYSITGPGDTALGVRAAAAGGDSRTVILTTDPQQPDVEYVLALQMGSVSTSTIGTVAFPANNSSEPFMMSAVALTNTSVLLTFNLKMDAAVSLNPSYYSISNPDLAVSSAVLGGGGYNITLTTSPQAEATYTVKATNIKSTTGVFVDPDFNSGTFEGIGLDDANDPSLVAAEATSYTNILLSFSEPVENFAAETTSYSLVQTATPDPLVLLIYGAVPNEFSTQVMLQTQPMEVGEEYTVIVSNVEDRSGNVIDSTANSVTFEFTGGVTNPGEPTDAPRVVGAIPVSNTLVDVHFSEPMGDSAADPEHYRITGSETAFLYVVEAILSTDRTTARLTTSSQGQDHYTVQAAGVKDLDGNTIAAPSSSLLAIVGLDPTKAQFLGIAPSIIDEHTDTDGDGFADWFETVGWPIIITNQNGDVNRAFVTSNPYNPDTDADGLTDGEENAYEFDPRTDDTDADRVTDGDEFNVWYSDPADQDSDDDGFDDYLEINFFLTSPILADTDGDQMTDDEEIMERNRNPFVADLPLPQITVDEITMEINVTSSFTNEENESESFSQTNSSTFSQSRSQTLGRSDTTTTQTELEFGQEIGAEGGTGGFKVSGKANFGQNLANGYSSTVNSEQSQESSQEFQESVTNGLERSRGSSVTRNIDSAIVQASVNIANKSNLAFTITNIEVSLLQQDRLTGLSLRPIATLRPTGADDATSQPVFNLAPLEQERGPIIFENATIFPNRIEDLMREPTGLVFDVVNFDVLDENGRNLVFTSQDVEDKTVGITIDFGDGRVEYYRVATASPFDDFGRQIGISMHRALELVGIGRTVSSSPDERNTYETLVDVRTGTGKVELPSQCNDGQDNDCDEEIDCLDEDCELTLACACGNGTCKAPENKCNCAADCGTPPDSESGSCADGVDNDCDEDVDCLDSDCAGATACPCDESTETTCGDSKDNDCDGLSDCADPDCDSATGCACVSSAEVCNDNLDNDCDGSVDCLDSNCTAHASCTTCGAANTLVEVPVRIRDVRNSVDGKQYWRMITSNTNLDPNTHFSRMPLRAHDAVLLMFTSDVDGDKILRREEYLYGSDDTKTNSDGDSLDDYEEIKTGWTVERVPGLPYKTFPSPARSDSDLDGLLDDEERAAGTDPNRRDTDEDGLSDTSEIEETYPIRLFDGDAITTNDKVLNVTPYSDWAIIAGADGACDTTTPAGDDAVAETSGATKSHICIAPGPNGVIDTVPLDDDKVAAAPKIDAGPNGVCDTTATPAGDDAREFVDDADDQPESKGTLGKVCISAGADGQLGTSPAPTGDDFVRTLHAAPTPRITAGPDGDCDTATASGDDVKEFTDPLKPFMDPKYGAVCISPGNNNVLQTTPASGDAKFYRTGVYGTDPLRRDTDADGVPDRFEATLGSNPNAQDAGSITDTDGDGLYDSEETKGWIRGTTTGAPCQPGTPVADCFTSDKTRPDTDFDGIPDVLERSIGSDPRSTDTDGDTLLDYEEFGENSSWKKPDGNVETYNDVVLDAGFARCDAAPNCSYTPPSSSDLIGTHPVRVDSDGDGRNDNVEHDQQWTVSAQTPDEDVSYSVKSDPNDADFDYDRLTDSQEATLLTDPNEDDTDQDTITDGNEVNTCLRPAGTPCLDPLKPDRLVTFQFTTFVADNDCDDPGIFDGAELGDGQLRFKPPGGSFENFRPWEIWNNCNGETNDLPDSFAIHQEHTAPVDDAHSNHTPFVRTFYFKKGDQFSAGAFDFNDCDGAGLEDPLVGFDKNFEYDASTPGAVAVEQIGANAIGNFNGTITGNHEGPCTFTVNMTVKSNVYTLRNGEACTPATAGLCKTGNCVDGVCCDTACNTTCKACNLAGTVGTCTNIPVGQDPGSECTNACDGNGACQP